MRTMFERAQVALLLAVAAAACGGSGVPAQQAGPPATDSSLVSEAMSRNQLPGPLQIVFAWALQERESKFSGDGVTRVAPPDRARLDLFGPRGEGYLSAAFVAGEVRLPPGAPSTPLPPPPLLWSALGVFQPPPGTNLVRTRQDGNRLELDYAAGDETWRYRFENGRLRHVEWTARRGGRRTVELEGAAALGLPGKAVYRDWPQFVELRLTLSDAFNVAGFSPDIWNVGQN